MSRRHTGAFAAVAVAATVAGLLASACGGQAFAPTFVEHEEPEFSRVMRAIDGAPARTERSVIALVTPAPQKLVVWDLANGATLFESEVDAVSAPIVAGDLVLLQQARGVVARRLDTGAEAFVLDEEGARLVGADADGGTVVVSLARGPVESPRGVVVGVRGGDVVWSHELQLPAGVPAITGGIVIVPWATQRITLLDAIDGHERARVRVRDAVVGQAFVSEGAAYVGQHGLFHVTPAIQSGSKREAEYFEPRSRPLPAQPPMLRDGYEPVPPPDNAYHRVRMVWQVARDGDEMKPRDGVVYFLFYRFLFAFDAESDALRWVYAHPTDLVGASSVPGGVVLVAQDGMVIALDAARGGVASMREIGGRVQAATVRPGTSEAPLAASESTDGAEAALAARLHEIATTNDPRLAAGRALAARYLARAPGAEVTAELVALCENRDNPESLRIEACQGVGERTEGQDAIRVALDGHASFLEGKPAPPVGALARAAGHMHLRGVVPKLLEHLADPATPSAELPGLLEGLGALGVRSAAEPVEAFLRLYHADASDPHLTQAAVAAANALAALRGDHAEEALRAVVDDPFSVEAVRTAAREAIAALNAPPPADQPPAPETPPPTDVPAEDTRPERITPPIMTRVLQPVHRRLVACLAETTRAVRVALVVDPDGTVRTVVTSPNDAQACIEPIVRSVRFPETRMSRAEQLTYTVRR